MGWLDKKNKRQKNNEDEYAESLFSSTNQMQEHEIPSIIVDKCAPVSKSACGQQPDSQYKDCSCSDCGSTSYDEEVTFSEKSDTHFPADKRASASVGDVNQNTAASNQSAFQSSIVTLRPAENLRFLVADETCETEDTIRVTNTSSSTLAFKIKTTNPDSFRVRPSTGLVRPGETSEIFVYLQPGCYDNVSREKFLIMIMLVEEGAKLSSLGEKWRSPPKDPEQYMEHRLWCTMKKASEFQQQDMLQRCEEVLTNLSKQMKQEQEGKETEEDDIYDEVVNELAKSQQRLEQKMTRLFGCQMLIGFVFFLLGLTLLATFFFEVNPFATSCSNSSVYSACAPYKAWKN